MSVEVLIQVEELVGKAFSMAFFRALWLGELVPSSTLHPQRLLQGAVDLYEARVEFSLRQSKTDQLGILFEMPGLAVCLLCCMQKCGCMRIWANLPFLVHLDWFLLSRFQSNF